MPELDRLIELHRKYCSGTNKTVEDLQRDLYCLSDDI